MAKKKSRSQITNSVDENGFHHLTPTPGGKFDCFQREFMGIRVPKSSDKFLYDLVETYGVEKVIGMTDIDIGNYIYQKGITHALNMNVGRNIPWIEDGLKSGERRALYTMWRMKLMGGKKEKVASITGEMIKTVYPHGDAAAADTIYRLGRSRSMMIPYVTPGGDFGNMDVMRPASPRYASASLSPYAVDCFFTDIGPRAPLYDEKDNYNFSSKEPVFLTSRYPNMLMQWNQGIGKGASAWLGAFNSKDLFKVAIQMLDDPNCKVDIYPDLPVPAQIVNKNKLKGCFDQARFKVQIRAPFNAITYQRVENGHKVDVYALEFTALPLAVIGDVVKTQIAEIKRQDEKTGNRRLPEVKAIHTIVDDKSAGGIRFLVEYEKGYDPNVLAEKLFRMTSLSKTVGVQYILITDNQTVEFTPRKIMKQWISQRFDQKRRLFHQKVLQAAKDRARLEAIATVLDNKNTDIAISIIRKSKNKAEALERLKAKFGFTEFQARMVMMVRLENLPQMDIKATLDERDRAIEDYKYYRSLLISDDKIKDIIRTELEDGLKKYGKTRMAPITNLDDDTSSMNGTLQKWLFYSSDRYYCTDDPAKIKSFADELNRSYKMISFKNEDLLMIVTRKSKFKVLTGFSFSANEQGIEFSTMGIDPGDVVRVIPHANSQYTHIATVTDQGYCKLMTYDDCTKSDKGSLVNLMTGDYLADIIPLKYTEDHLIGVILGSNFYYVNLADFPILKRASAGNRTTIRGPKSFAGAQLVDIDMTDLDYILMYGESGYVKMIDSMYLSFNKKRSNILGMGGKMIHGILGLSQKSSDIDLYDAAGKTEIVVAVDKSVKFTTSTGETLKFKMSTSIGNSVKVFKKTKNDFYTIWNHSK